MGTQEKVLNGIIEDSMKSLRVETTIVDAATITAGGAVAVIFGRKALQQEEDRAANLALASLGAVIAGAKVATILRTERLKRQTEQYMDDMVEAIVGSEL